MAPLTVAYGQALSDEALKQHLVAARRFYRDSADDTNWRVAWENIVILEHEELMRCRAAHAKRNPYPWIMTLG